jgi:hypothetical protein
MVIDRERRPEDSPLQPCIFSDQKEIANRYKNETRIRDSGINSEAMWRHETGIGG